MTDKNTETFNEIGKRINADYMDYERKRKEIMYERNRANIS